MFDNNLVSPQDMPYNFKPEKFENLWVDENDNESIFLLLAEDFYKTVLFNNNLFKF